MWFFTSWSTRKNPVQHATRIWALIPTQNWSIQDEPFMWLNLFRFDRQIQTLVDKLIPNIVDNDIQNEIEFYKKIDKPFQPRKRMSEGRILKTQARILTWKQAPGWQEKQLLQHFWHRFHLLLIAQKQRKSEKHNTDFMTMRLDSS